MLLTRKFCGICPLFHGSFFSPPLWTFYWKRLGLAHPSASGLIYLLKDRIGKGGRVVTFRHIHQRKGQFLLETEVTQTNLWMRGRGQREKIKRFMSCTEPCPAHLQTKRLRRCPSPQGKASFKPQTTSSLSPYLNISASLSKGGGHEEGCVSLYPIKLATGGG